MAYDEQLAERIRSYLSKRDDVAEKKMMGGLTFMVDDKMCVGASRNGMLVRFDPGSQEALLKKPGTTLMELGNRISNGYLFVNADEYKNEAVFRFWMETALAYNKTAKSSKKSKKA